MVSATYRHSLLSRFRNCENVKCYRKNGGLSANEVIEVFDKLIGAGSLPPR
jgi:hypothetical protein